MISSTLGVWVRVTFPTPALLYNVPTIAASIQLPPKAYVAQLNQYKGVLQAVRDGQLDRVQRHLGAAAEAIPWSVCAWQGRPLAPHALVREGRSASYRSVAILRCQDQQEPLPWQDPHTRLAG